MTIICPRCGYQRTDKEDPSIPTYECPSCGIVYHKYEKTNPVKLPEPETDSYDAKVEQIAKEIGDDRFYTQKELKHLRTVMMPDETLLSFASGLMEGNTWLIALTDKRIIFIDKGLIFGVRQAFIDLDKINAVSGTTGIIFGNIVIQDGARSRIITNVPKSTVIPFTNKIRDTIENRKNALTQQTPIDPIEKLEKLASLLEKGLITQEEFKQQKQKLLSQ